MQKNMLFSSEIVQKIGYRYQIGQSTSATSQLKTKYKWQIGRLSVFKPKCH